MNSAGHKASKMVANESRKRNLFEAVLGPLIFSCWVAAGVLWGTTARAAEIYVSPGGAQSAPYDNWANAFTNLQDAFDYGTDGDTIQLAGQLFAGVPTGDNDSVFSLTNKANLTIIGGYQAAGDTPGPRDPHQWPTVIARADGNARVLNIASVSNLLLRAVTIRDGWLRGTTIMDGGGALLSSGRAVSFENVRILANKINGGDTSRGSGVSLVNSDLTLTDCLIAENELRHETPTLGNLSRGGGMSLVNSRVDMVRGSITTNLVNPNRVAWGGGVYLDGASAMTVSNANIIANHCKAEGSAQGWGGAFYVTSGATLTIWDSLLQGNIAERGQVRSSAYGGAIYNGGTTEIYASVLDGNKSVSDLDAYGGGMYNARKLLLRNVLVKGNQAGRFFTPNGSGIEIGATATQTHIDQCTIVDNEPGVGVGIRYNGGLITVSNSIVWGHAEGLDLATFPRNPDGCLPGVWYSNVGDAKQAGRQGCHATDPLFADSIWYHLSSTAGHYIDGYFDKGHWDNAKVNSPLIDRGAPEADFNHEPAPHGDRLNMGVYANTEVAAKTPAAGVQPPTVAVGKAIDWGRTAATLYGTVTFGGDEMPLAFFDVWPAAGGATNTFPMGLQTHALEQRVEGLAPGTDYRFRVRATNAAGTALSAEASFATRSMEATSWYITPGGDNTSGASWSAAHTNPSMTFEQLVSGDTVYLAGNITGTPLERDGKEAILLQNAADIRLLGGYEGALDLPVDDHPGPRDPERWPTLLRPATATARVLSLVSVSNVVVESVTIRDGKLSVYPTAAGGGVYLTNALDIVFSACRIVNNTAYGHPSQGGGIYLKNSDLLLNECRVSSNRLYFIHGGFQGLTYGGGVYIDGGSRVTAWHSQFDSNLADTYGNAHGYGGGFYVASTGKLELRDSQVCDNLVKYGQNNTSAFGGGLCVVNGGEVKLLNTQILHNEARGLGTGKGCGGGIYNQGTVALRNVLLAQNFSNPNARLSDGIEQDLVSARLVVESSTLAKNNAGTLGNVGLRNTVGAIALTNTIIWGHAEDLLGLSTNDAGNLLNVSHCLFGAPTAMNGIAGCIAGIDPLFAGASDYRLQDGSSAFGETISPAVDAGITLPWMRDATDIDGNRRVNGSRRNLGRLVDIGAYETEGVAASLFLVR